MNEKIKAYYVADDIDEVLNYIDNLEQENARLKDKIDKAIEYIKEKQKIQYKFALSHIECDDLLEILRGKNDKENN